MNNYLEFLIDLWKISKEDGFKTWTPLIAKHGVNKSIGVVLRELELVALDADTKHWFWQDYKPTKKTAEIIQTKIAERVDEQKKAKTKLKSKLKTGLNKLKATKKIVKDAEDIVDNDFDLEKKLMTKEWILTNVEDKETISVLENAIENPNTVDIKNPEIVDAISNINNPVTDSDKQLELTESIQMPYTIDDLNKDITDVLFKDADELIKNKPLTTLQYYVEAVERDNKILQTVIKTERQLDADRVEVLNTEIENLKLYNSQLEFNLEQSKMKTVSLKTTIEEKCNNIDNLTTNLNIAENQLALVAKLLKDANTELYKIKSSKLYKYTTWFRK